MARRPLQQLMRRLLPALRTADVSLHRQLMLWVLVPQIVLWLAGGLAAYKLAERYTNGAVDASLSQASRALARQLKPLGDGLLIDFPRAAQDVLEADPNDRQYYNVSSPPGAFLLGNHQLPLPPPEVLSLPMIGVPYFYDGVLPETSPTPGADGSARRIRIAAVFLRYGVDATADRIMLVQVARSRTSREELARSILIDTLLPLASLMLLMTLIVWAGIRAGLAPLERLRSTVEAREPTDLTPIRLASAPREVRSLVAGLNALFAAVQHNVATQQRFLSDAAHQLRTPLAGLKSQTELALQLAPEGEQQRRLARVHESATRSAHLVNQLLTLARAEPDSAAVQGASDFDLRSFAGQLTAEWVPRAWRAGVDLGVDLEIDAGAGEADVADAVHVHGNAFLLREAITNLIDNAVHYAGRGAVVTVSVRRADGQAILEVLDDGPGIAEADLPRVFERFVRATDLGQGCGLGLPIVREVLQRMHGSVSLANVQPHGLRATVTLPLVAPTAVGATTADDPAT